MHLNYIDWTIVVGLILIFGAIGYWTKKFTRSVSGFLAADRLGGRYLLSTAQNIAGVGAITFVAAWEIAYKIGLGLGWWSYIAMPLGVVIGMSGWVVYRYRRSRSMTMGQFFEIRYSRRFRIFAGMLAWIAGVMSYGIAPAITAKFLIVFCGFPTELHLGDLTIPTIAPIMLVMLSIALFLTFCGGQIAVMVTDFLQGQIVIVGLTVIALVLISKIGWNNIFESLKGAGDGYSKVNPFDVDKLQDINIWTTLIGMFFMIYNHACWPERQAYYCSAKSPHEAKMSSILGIWRGQLFMGALALPALCVFALMHNPEFSAEAATVTESLRTFSSENTRLQMTTPMGLSQMLPMGFMGLFAVMVMSAAVTTDDTSLHAWGSLFVQDIIMPFRKKPLEAKEHMRYLRVGIVGVAIFAFTFSLLFPVQDYLTMLLYALSSVYLVGAGVCLIGGLYWKRGTTTGAWAAMILGASLAVLGIILKTWWSHIPILNSWYESCPVNGFHMGAFNSVVAIVTYVVVSLVTGAGKKSYDLDKMLHRKRDEQGNLIEEKTDDGKKKLGRKPGILGKLGVTEEFSKGDIAIYIASICWTLFWVVSFIIGTIYGICVDTTEDTWIPWWKLSTIVILVLSVLWGVWFFIGGAFDLRYMFRKLASFKEDDHDDGWVDEKESQDDQQDAAS